MAHEILVIIVHSPPLKCQVDVRAAYRKSHCWMNLKENKRHNITNSRYSADFIR